MRQVGVQQHHVRSFFMPALDCQCPIRDTYDVVTVLTQRVARYIQKIGIALELQDSHASCSCSMPWGLSDIQIPAQDDTISPGSGWRPKLESCGSPTRVQRADLLASQSVLAVAIGGAWWRTIKCGIIACMA